MILTASHKLLCLLVTILSVVPTQILWGQYVDYDRLLDHLQLEINLSNPKALRDLGTLLDNPEVKGKAKNMLIKHTLFTAEELDLNQPVSRQQFLDFYYHQQKNIKYSQLLNAFYLTPIESQPAAYDLQNPKRDQPRDLSTQLRKLILRLEAFVATGDDAGTIGTVKKIGELKLTEGYKYLLDILARNRLFLSNLKKRGEVIEEICQVLVDYPNNETFKTFIQLVQDDVVSTNTISPLLQKLTNISVVEDQNYSAFIKRYNYWFDSLGTVENMRIYGYDMVFRTKKDFFQFPVDYYGKILSLSNKYPWIRHNARKDLIKTKHPRALFYLAALLYKYRFDEDKLAEFKAIEEEIYTLTKLNIGIETKNGLSFNYDLRTDGLALLNYVKYWAVHAGDFDWDEIRSVFVNREAALALTENYERLYRRLNSNNDSVAMQSYLLLTEADPVEVTALAKKYKDLLRNYNRSLPSMKYRYLEQLVKLTSFCRRNNVRYKAPGLLQSFLNDLGRARTEQERFEIENSIIERLQLDEVTALEYWGCLNESQLEISFSVGRILDKFYTKNWEKIIKNETYLRLYLKKSSLFSKIGVLGVCNEYLKKFEYLSKVERKTLEEMLKIESDADIIEQINFLLFDKTSEPNRTVNTLLDPQITLNREALIALPTPSSKDLKNIYQHLLDDEHPSMNRQIWIYLNHHLSVDFVPFAMLLLQNQTSEKETLEWLKIVFNFEPADKAIGWLQLWEQDGADYNNWPRRFFDERLKTIKDSDVVDIQDINAITQSAFYHASLKNTCLLALRKVVPQKNIRRLKFPEPLSIAEDLVFFQDFDFGHKELDDIPKLFNLKTDLEVLIDWLIEKSAGFPIEEKGDFYNSLFRSNWFADYVSNDQLKGKNAAIIRQALEGYLDESNSMSEFEELEIQKNIVLIDNSGKNLVEKIKNTLSLNIDENSRKKIEEEILSRISYEEIPLVAPYLNDLKVVEHYNFLSKDFGLPIFKLDDYDFIQELIANHQSMSQMEFYEHYLADFGVDFKKNNGSLDFDKIYEILQYEIITPFVGDGGNHRDYYTFGIIKLLELQFGTDLGFHEKLNENQTFYTYSSFKRALAWQEYLLDKQIVKTNAQLIPSFNVTAF